MKLRKINKKAQLRISFGMIFTIILIIFLLAFAFASIRKSVVRHDEILAAKFIHDLKVDIQEVWVSQQALIKVKYKLPEDINEFYFEPPPDEEDWDEGYDESLQEYLESPNVYFDNTKYKGGHIEKINWKYSNDEILENDGGDDGTGENGGDNEEDEGPLVFEAEDGVVSFYLIKKYGVENVIIDKDGILNIPVHQRDFYVGAPQNHGTYEEILSKGESGEYRVLFNIDFEERDYGKWETYSEFRASWNGASWGNRGEEAEVVPDPSDTNNKAMLIEFPFWDPSVNETWICWDSEGRCSDEEGRRIYFTNGYATDRDPSLVNPSGEPTFTNHRVLLNNVGTGSGGLSFSIPLKGNFEEVYLSYNIKHEPDWAAPAGGKLPGLQPSQNKCPACAPTDCMDQSGNQYKYEWDDDEDKWIYYDNNGNVIQPDGIADDFSTRHMFHRNDHISYYYYDYDKKNVCGDSGGVPDSAKIFDGNWHNVVLRVRMNDPGVANGVTETWIDGENHGAMTGHLFRTEGSDFGIGKIAFDNFFGGSGLPCSDVERRFEESCENGEWWDPDSDWIKACAIDINDPCKGYWKYSDGTAQSYWGNRKTEYIHFDDIVAYIPY